MSTAIILNFVNQTGDIPSADVVICQHNARAGMRANPVAWQVLRNIGYGGNRRFEIPPDLEFSAQDDDGNTLPRFSVEQGQVFGIGQAASDQTLQALPDTASAQKHLELRNYLAAGTVTANVFRSGKLLAAISDIAPRETAAFQFHPHVYVGLAAQAQEGEVLSIAAASMITTRLNLLCVRSADIVMTSSGKNAQLPNFRLENIRC